MSGYRPVIVGAGVARGAATWWPRRSGWWAIVFEGAAPAPGRHGAQGPQPQDGQDVRASDRLVVPEDFLQVGALSGT